MSKSQSPDILRILGNAGKNALDYLKAEASAAWRILIFIFLLLLSWLPIAFPCYQFIPDRNWVSILTLVGLYVEFVIGLWLWGRWVDRTPRIWARYGFCGGWQYGREVLQGFLLAAGCLWSLFLAEGALGWLEWRSPETFPFLLRVLAEGSLVGMGIGLAEELFFRGWLLTELTRDYRPQVGLIVTSLIYAALHFIKPLPEILQTLPQFGGLLMLGLILVWARWRTQGRLGFSMGLHAGLVGSYYWINVGELTRYTHLVPEWVTGIHQNPLAGLGGLVTLGLLALLVRRIPVSKFN